MLFLFFLPPFNLVVEGNRLLFFSFFFLYLQTGWSLRFVLRMEYIACVDVGGWRLRFARQGWGSQGSLASQANAVLFWNDIVASLSDVRLSFFPHSPSPPSTML